MLVVPAIPEKPQDTLREDSSSSSDELDAETDVPDALSYVDLGVALAAYSCENFTQNQRTSLVVVASVDEFPVQPFESQTSAELIPQPPLTKIVSQSDYSNVPTALLRPVRLQFPAPQFPVQLDMNECAPPATSSPEPLPPFLESPDVESTTITHSHPSPVQLEKVVFDPNGLRGTVTVANLAYCKEVSVRWTSDNWNTFCDTECTYQLSDVHSNRDTFTFVLPSSKSGHGSLAMCVCYQVCGNTFYDNNHEENYQF